MRNPEKLKCPVCRAAFRNDRTCSRCGADLTMLMLTTAKANLLKKRALTEIAGGSLENAKNLASQSLELKHSNSANKIKILAYLLSNHP